MNLNYLIFWLMAAVAGSLIPIQGVLNSRVGFHFQQPLVGTFVNFVGGTIIVSILLFILKPQLLTIEHFKSLPWYFYLGGALGVFFVSSVVLGFPVLGATTLFATLIAGQLIMSVLVDHFGWLGAKVDPISWQKALGVVLLMAGVLLVSAKK